MSADPLWAGPTVTCKAMGQWAEQNVLPDTRNRRLPPSSEMSPRLGLRPGSVLLLPTNPGTLAKERARLCGSGSLVGRQSPSSGNPAGGTPASCPPGEAVSWAARWEPTQPSWREEVPLICGHLHGHCLSQLHACRRSGCPDVRPGAQEGKARSQSQDRMKIHCPPPPPGLPRRAGNVCGEHRVFTGNGAITPGSGEAWAKARRPVAGWGGLPRALWCWGRDGSRAGRGTEMCAQVIDGRWASGSEEGWGRTAPLRPGGPPSIPVSGRGHRGSVVGTCQGWTHPSGSGSTSSSPG